MNNSDAVEIPLIKATNDTLKGYGYLIESYEKAEKLAREEHVPSIIHVIEMTQPTGHSTSGSHERYKSKERDGSRNRENEYRSRERSKSRRNGRSNRYKKESRLNSRDDSYSSYRYRNRSHSKHNRRK